MTVAVSGKDNGTGGGVSVSSKASAPSRLPSTPLPPASEPTTAVDIRIHASERGAIIGQSGCGKSTLATKLIEAFMDEYPQSRVLILDSKPRYRATFSPSGLGMNYKNWAKGDTIDGSVAVHRLTDLDIAYKVGRCAVFQSLTPSGHQIAAYEREAASMADWLFRHSGPRNPTLLYVDEFYDILHGPGGFADQRILKVIRAGRERNMASLFAAQRPKSIPLPTLTEATNYWLFRLEYADDVKYMRQHGPQLATTANGHEFVFYRRLSGGRRIERKAVLGNVA